MKIVFMGTPDFAATILRYICAWDGADVAAVYCQPDRPAGRGHKLTPPPVKVLAQSLGLPVLQPLNFKADADVATLAAFAPDMLVVAAYGLLLPQRVLDIPSRAPINVHASLLPRYRGAAPIQRAIMDGEQETGVSIMRMEASLDTGPVYAMRAIPVGAHTAATLHDALAELGAQTLLEVLEQFRIAVPEPVIQDESKATHAPKLTKADGAIDWSRAAQTIDNQVRAVTPWPGARCVLPDDGPVPRAVLLLPGSVGEECDGAPGTWVRLPSGDIAVTTVDRYYVLSTLRPENRSHMTARDFANGYFAPGVGPCVRAGLAGGA